VPVEFFFEGAPHARGQHSAQTEAPSPQYVSDYLATPDGLKLLGRLDEPVEEAHRSQLGHMGKERLRALASLLEGARAKIS